MAEQDKLARTIGFPLLVLYGLGTILGAGIYVLIGTVAGASGMMAPLAFLIAALVAWVTALSYSQLVVLFPRSAGEAVYIENAFGRRYFTIIMGVLIVFTGIVSAATLTNAFSGYFKIFFPVSDFLAVVIVIFILTSIAIRGITESLLISGFITLIELSGLVLILAFRADVLLELPSRASEIFIPRFSADVFGVISGAFLAFYAFIGFEDMVNVVEEVKNPKKIMPRAILLVIIISTVLYMLISLVAVLALPINELAESDVPLTLLLEDEGPFKVQLIAVIGVIAIVNGVLIQIIMASRVVYGMSLQYGENIKYSGFKLLSFVHPTTQTPIVATLIIAVLVLLFALLLPLEVLAKVTSFIILIVFSCVNIALCKIRLMPEYKGRILQQQYPVLGAALCVALIGFQLSGL